MQPCGGGTRQEVKGAVIRSVTQHAAGFDFTVHLTKLMIYFRDESGDRCAGTFSWCRCNSEFWEAQTTMQVVLRPLTDFFVLSWNLRVMKLHPGESQIIWWFVVTDLKGELLIGGTDLQKGWLVHRITEPVPIGPPSMALIFRGYCSGCVGMLSCIMVL